MFFSASKFREYVREHEKVTSDVVIFFDPNDTFTTKFHQIGLKPLAVMVFDDKGQEEIATHQFVLQICDGEQPIVCISPAFFGLNKERKLQALTLQEPKVSSKGFRYSPCRGYSKYDDRTVDLILKSRI